MDRGRKGGSTRENADPPTHTHTPGNPVLQWGIGSVTRGRSVGLPEMLSISLSHNTPLPPEQPRVAQGGPLYLSANKQPKINRYCVWSDLLQKLWICHVNNELVAEKGEIQVLQAQTGEEDTSMYAPTKRQKQICHGS